VIDVRRKFRVWIGVVEGLREQDLVDGVRGRLDASGASEIFPQRLPNEVPEGHPPCFRRLGGAPVKVGRKQELGPVHV